jgi:hypothetical protein
VVVVVVFSDGSTFGRHFSLLSFFFPLERGEEEDDGEEDDDERKRIRNEVQYRDNYDGEDTGEP